MGDTSLKVSMGHKNSDNISTSLSFGSKSLQASPSENSINIGWQTKDLDTTNFNFGFVPNGTSVCKTVQLHNSSMKTQVYTITRDPAAMCADDCFEIHSANFTIGPGEEFTFALRYAPKVPNVFNFDYFNVSDTEGICLQFAAKGASKGPSLTTSDKKLTFVRTAGSKKSERKIIEFKNESSVLAIYDFDVDLKNGVFMPDPPCGSVKGQSYAYVGISFNPPGPGIYTKDLFCLVHCQNPIVIKLEGVCTANSLKLHWRDLNIVPVPQAYHVKHGFDWYFENDVLEPGSARQVLKVRSWNIDFGATLVGADELPKHFTVINLAKKDVFMTWCKDLDDTFTIRPQSQVIVGGGFGVFSARFRPKKADTFYSVEMNGFSFWNYVPVEKIEFALNQKVYMPVDAVVRLMGHTFPDEGHGWIPQYEIRPDCVTLPPAVPPLCTYSTFIIERSGQLPVMFKFCPPAKTHFSVRPMQGLLSQKYQVLVVQLRPGSFRGTVDEEWTIRFNGHAHFDGKIHIRGYSQLPALQTDTDPVNVVVFPPTHPGCVGYVDVPVRNLTRHCIRYKFVSSETLTKVSMEGGDTMIAPNERLIQTWSFVPHETGVREIEVTLEAVVLQDCTFPIGMPVETTVMTFQHSQYAELVAFPRVLEFGPCWLQARKRADFHLFNFGVCAIHYQLTCVQRNIIIEDCEDDLSIEERWNTVPPNSAVQVEIELRPTQRGLQEFAVIYQVRHSDSSSWLIDDPPKEVMQVNYEGILPKMKAVEILAVDIRKLMNRKWIWMALDLNGFNEAIATSLPNSRVTIAMNFPEAPLGADDVGFRLYLQNHGELDTEWRLKRSQRCDCKHVQKSKGLSFREKLYECPHRQLFTISEPLNGTIQAGAVYAWQLTIRYSLLGSHDLVYTLELSNNRKFALCAKINVLPPDEPRLSLVTPVVFLESIYIGDLQPQLQVFWLYNNYNEDQEYAVGVSQLGKFSGNPYDSTQLECLNPTGTVRACNVQPIFFKFDPFQMKYYETIVSMQLGGKLVELTASGTGTVNYLPHPKRLYMPVSDSLQTPEYPLVFSLNHIVVEKLVPTHSKIDRIFIFKNQTAQQYSFEWQELNVEGIVSATVSPARGNLQPFQILMCKMSIESGGHPTIINATFSVQTVNLTEKRAHDKSMFLYREANRILQEEFVISAQGMTTPTNRTSKLPMPTTVNLSIGLKVSIVSPIDLDSKVSHLDQLKHAPGMQPNATVPPKAPVVTPEDATIVTDELEKILWDSLSSKWLQETIFSFGPEKHVFYSQFFMSRQKEALMREKLTTVPSRRLVKRVITSLLYQVLQEFFKFATVADDSDIYTARRESFKSGVSAFDVSNNASDVEMSQRSASKYSRINSELGLRIKFPDAW